ARRAEAVDRDEAPRRARPDRSAEVHAAGRERGPSHVLASRAPGHPRRAPDRSWYPDPAAVLEGGPAAVVKRCPTPRPTRLPGPTEVGEDPASVGCVGTEGRSDDRGGWRPDPT